MTRMLILNSIGLLALFTVSLWLLYINHKLLKVTQDIEMLTKHIDEVSVDLCELTQQMVDNTSIPPHLQ